MLKLAEALHITNQSKPFQIRFVSFNKAKQSGGKIIQLTKAVRVGAKYNLKNNDMICVKQLNNTNHPYPVHNFLIIEVNNQRVIV